MMVIFSSDRTTSLYDPPCGFSSSPSWKNCPYGDNQRRQRTFVRYVYDEDGDGFPVGLGF